MLSDLPPTLQLKLKRSSIRMAYVKHSMYSAPGGNRIKVCFYDIVRMQTVQDVERIKLDCFDSAGQRFSAESTNRTATQQRRMMRRDKSESGHWRGRICPWCVLLIFVFSGCSRSGTLPELGEVSGVITIDGRPLRGAWIVFRPLEGGRSATAQSDDEGKYELSYLIYPRLTKGTRIGKNAVFVSTYQGTAGNMRKIRPELVPECYRGTESELIVHVKRGRNVIDLKLRTDCDQPEKEPGLPH